MTFLKKLNKAPFELKAYAVFATLTTLLSFILPIVLEKDIWEKTIQYTGWGRATSYMFSLIFIFSPIYGSLNYKYSYSSRYIKPEWGILFMLGIQISSGVHQQSLVAERSNETNPYLMVNEYQYIWTILVPSFWCLLIFFSPNIKRFYEELSQESK